MDDEISIQLFCHSLYSWIRPMLRSVKVLLEFGLSGHAARDCWLGWFRNGSDGAILLLRVFWGLGMLKRPETIVVWRHWFGRSLRPGKPSNSPRGAEGATMARRVPFPPSSIPAYIEQSMKLFVCLIVSTIRWAPLVTGVEFSDGMSSLPVNARSRRFRIENLIL